MTRPFPARRRPALWAALLVALACPAAAKPDFEVLPQPARVRPIAPPEGADKKEPEDGLRCMLDDRRLVVVHVRCDGCRATRDFYFDLAAGATTG